MSESTKDPVIRPQKLQKCPFCGHEADRMSAEHPFGKWARDYVDHSRPFTRLFHRRDDGAGGLTQKSLKRAGDPLYQTVRSACEACNNTWMSRLQDRAAPVLLHYVQGGLDMPWGEKREAIAAWAQMVTMNIEYFDPELAVVTQGERDQLRQTERALPNWLVGIANYSGTRLHGCFNHGHYKVPWPDRPGDPPRSLQSTCFAVGQLLVHTLSADDPSAMAFFLDPEFLFGYGENLIAVWPDNAPIIAGNQHDVTDEKLATLINLFRKEPLSFERTFPPA